MKKTLLMKDYSVKYKKSIEKYYKDIQFILYPCDLELNTYLLVEPNSYMLRMNKAKVIIESVVQRCGYDYRDHYYPIGRIEKILNSYDELIQYLFSIEKTLYYNKVMEMSEVQDIPPYISIKYCFFSIRLYDEDDKVIFKKKININEEVKNAAIYISSFFGAGSIVNNLRDIYFSELSLFKEHISIDPNNNKWDLGHDEYRYSLCAVWLEETNSISFFHKNDANRLKHINNLYVDSNVFGCFIDNKKEFNDARHVPVSNCPSYDLMYFDYPLILEYIIYLPYINMVLRMCAKIANQEYTDEIRLTEDDYYVRTHMEIEIYHTTHNLHFKDNDPFTLENLMDILDLEGD